MKREALKGVNREESVGPVIWLLLHYLLFRRDREVSGVINDSFFIFLSKFKIKNS